MGSSQCKPEKCENVCIVQSAQAARPCVVGQQLLSAARDGDSIGVRVCIANGANLETRQPLKLLTMDRYETGEPIKQKGFTALMYACQGGYEACVSALLDARARANAKDEDGTTALHLAAASGDIGCARLLLMAGAKCTLDEDGQGVLEYLPSDVRADSGEIKNWEDLISDSARK